MIYDSVIFIDKDGYALGKPNYDRWNKLNRVQKIIGRIFPMYKNRFVDIEGFNLLKEIKK